MWRAAMLLAIALSVSSCVGNKLRVEYAYGEPVYAGDALNSRGSGNAVDLNYGSVKVGKTVWESGSVGIDLFAGGFVAVPHDHESTTLAGVVVTPRIRYPVKPGVDAFVAPDLGLVFGKWKDQGSDFNFLVGGQTGVLIELNEQTDISLSTGLFHISNAGIEKENPGSNSDLFMVAFEYEL